MRFSFVYLSGSKRGKTESFQQEHIKIGTDYSDGLWFDPSIDKTVSRFHAELKFDKDTCEFILINRSPFGTFVNNHEISEVLLQDQDTVEFGKDGPKVKFLVHPEDYSKCEASREAYGDSTIFSESLPLGKVITSTSYLRQMLKDAQAESTRKAKMAIAAIMSLLMVVIAVLAYEIYNSNKAKQESQDRITELSKSIEAERTSRGMLEQKIADERQKFSNSIRSQQEMVERLRNELAEKEREIRYGLSKSRESDLAEIKSLRENIKTLESGRLFAENVIRKYGGGVCFIQGSYGFTEKKRSKFLRYQAVDDEGEPLKDKNGNILVAMEGNGPTVTIDYTATGFLAHRKGLILTNRHIVEPWVKSALAKRLMKEGYEPEFISFRAYFPNIKDPFDLVVAKTSDKADVAVVKANLRGLRLPVLKLNRNGVGAIPGGPVVLLGYPTGFDVLLAKADNKTSKEILAITDAQAEKLADELSKRKLIRPITTQGHISDILPQQIVYDAQTTVGGSGGPLFNSQGEVIAINYAILREFTGSNFGVPIRFAAELLE